MEKIVRVIIPPEPIVLPSDIAGIHGDDDAAVAAMIQAVTEEIDGPSGWVGRALGKQTLELMLKSWPSCEFKLPYPPIITDVSVAYADEAGAEQFVDEDQYTVSDGRFWFASGWAAPTLGEHPFPVRIRYEAGYDGEDVESGGTGPVPERARQAIILSVQSLKSLGAENLFLRSEEVEGVGTTQYTVSDQAGAVIKRASESLLSTLVVYA